MLGVMAAARHARVAIAIEAARDALSRRRRLAEGAPLERALYAFLADTFRAQGRSMDAALSRSPVDPTEQRAEGLMDAVWGRVSLTHEPAFTRGMTSAMDAGLRWGMRRAAEDIGAATEAVGVYRPPPDTPAGFDDLDGGRVALGGTPFRVPNVEAELFARRRGAELVRNVDDETRFRLRTLVVKGRAGGWSSDVLARNITREFPYMAVGSPLRHITSRAHLIAVTETAFAYERGQRFTARSAAGAGLRMVKSWLTVGDGHVDSRCSDNEAQGEIPYDESFVSLDEEPPAHPGCRCTSQYRALTRAEQGIPVEPTPPAPPGPANPFVAHGPAPYDADGAIRGRLSNGKVRPLDAADMNQMRIGESNMSSIPKARAEVREAIAELARDHRYAASRMTGGIEYAPHIAKNTYAQVQGTSWSNTSTMQLGARFRSPANLNAALRNDALAKTGPDHLPWHPVGDRAGEGLKSVIDHEFGHVIDYAQPDVIARFMGSELPTRLRASGAPLNAAGKAFVHNSRYALKDRAEHWAELFAEARSRRAYADLTPAGRVTREWLAEQEAAGVWAGPAPFGG